MSHEYTRRGPSAETVSAVGFLIAVVAVWFAGGMPAPGMTGLWLAGLCTLLVRVEFRVGAGKSTPVILAILPMLVLLPAPIIPLLVALTISVPRVVTRVARGDRTRPLA